MKRESLAWLVVLGIVAALDGWWTRALLTPDGAAYLDLADAVSRGAWGSVVQGYWSPLYPVLASLARALAGATGADRLVAVHLLNVLLAIGGAAMVHRLVIALHERWGARTTMPPALWQRCTWAAYAVCALVYARLDSVTPDLLLLVVMVAVFDELVRRGVERPVRLGLLLGAAFLAKTSSWPWLVVTWAWLASPWGARAEGAQGASGARVGRGALVTVAVVLAWLVPLSLTTGRPTLGSTGRLNACWFLRDCDGQSPDTHRGEHARYATLVASTGGELTFARLAGATSAQAGTTDAQATYAPWTDPTAWAAGVRTQRESPFSIGAMSGVVLDNLADALRYLGLYLYLAALAPALLWWAMARARLSWRGASRLALGVAAIGTIGIAQFVAVQVQPRLMAPFAWLQVAGVLAWLLAASADGSRHAGTEEARATSRGRREARAPGDGTARRPGGDGRGLAAMLARVPVLAVLVALVLVLHGDRVNAASDAAYRAELRNATTRASAGRTPRSVVVVGEAFLLVAHAKALDLVIVAQLLPASVATLDAIDPRERQRLLQQAGGGLADVAWQRQSDGRVRVTALR